jgi:hypothetical protein
MTRIEKHACIMAVSCAAWMAATGWAQAQPAGTAREAKPGPAAAAIGQRPKGMDEDIEIMRTILNQAIAKLRAGKETPGAAPMPPLGMMSGGMPPKSFRADMAPSYPPSYPSHGPYGPAAGATVIPLGFEGLFVKASGIVFTATLPLSYHDSVAIEIRRHETPKPSTWDRVRRGLSRDNVDETRVEFAEAEPIHKVILRALAENGHRIQGLAEDERVVVALTFRGEKEGGPPLGIVFPGMPPGAGASSGPIGAGTMAGAPYPAGSAASPGGSAGRGQGHASPADDPFAAPAVTASDPFGPADAGSGPAAKGMPSRQYELLGDLHLKQGRVREAVDAYRKALETESAQAATSGAVGRELARKATQALLAAGDEASLREAQALLTRALKDKAPPQPQMGASASVGQAKPSIPLPPKLIISAPKRLLDQVGAGKISFEDFAKATMMETVP